MLTLTFRSGSLSQFKFPLSRHSLQVSGINWSADGKSLWHLQQSFARAGNIWTPCPDPFLPKELPSESVHVLFIVQGQQLPHSLSPRPGLDPASPSSASWAKSPWRRWCSTFTAAGTYPTYGSVWTLSQRGGRESCIVSQVDVYGFSGFQI